MNAEKISIPKSGIAGLKENWKTDILSGFLVSLIALPLSLGIAKASGFPPIMGLWTAIVGGLVASFFGSAPLTIKGPAAGLIVICAGSVEAFGGGETGWHLALACVALAGVVQILFGVLKMGKLSDFFPSSAIHGMLAAIGIIIFAKQVPLLLGVDPALYKGFGPVKLLASIPNFIINMNKDIAIIGFVSLVIMFGLPQIKNKFIKKIPPAIVVLFVSIILGISFRLHEMPVDIKALLKVDNLFETLKWNVDFSGVASITFVKYFIMFLLIGSIESLLTAKAVNGLDPFKRKTNYNNDLIATGVGNTISGLFGGLPMISEIARSSANINTGARTFWSNFFHGLSLLLFVVLALGILNMIPNAALAAILISVGYRLASPKEFVHTWQIGKEQFVIFLGTIVMTLVEDLLVGIATGIVIKFIIHAINGVPLSAFFTTNLKIEKESDNKYLVEVRDAAVFSNFLRLKRELGNIPPQQNIVLDLSNTKLVDHTVMENLNSIAYAYENDGGSFKIIGLENHIAVSDHKFSARKKKH